MRRALKPILFSGPPGWVRAAYPDVWRSLALAAHFDQGLYWAQGLGQVSGDTLFSCTRSATKYVANAQGILVPIPANTLASLVGVGCSVEEARTNVVLWNRDLTNAAWTKSNTTAALTQTGADGTANSATLLTATAGNGTCLQAITLASSARFQSAVVKRVTGAGTIQMTMDNGATWTTIVVTSAFTKLTIPTQTLANPTVGFRIVTSGDAIAVDFVQNENSGFNASSSIPTTTAPVTRTKDLVAVRNAANYLGAGPWSLYSEQTVNSLANLNCTLFSVDDGTTTNAFYMYAVNGGNTLSRWANGASAAGSGGAGGSYVIGTKFRAGEIYRAGVASYMGALGSDSLPVTAPAAALNTILIGSSEWGGDGTSNAIYSRLAIFKSDIGNTRMNAMIQ